MNKRDLAKKLSYRFADIEKEDLEYIVDLFFEIIKKELKKGNRVEFRDFGVFTLKKSKGIMFYNPKNKQNYYIKGKYRILFKPGKELKQRLNTPFLASLDLGTQTFRFCIGKVVNGDVNFLMRERENVRLGEGLSREGIISSEAFKRGLECLKMFKEKLSRYEVKNYKAIGTEVFRKARNAEEFIDKVRKETGFEISIISPEEEASLTLKGISFGLEELGININKFVIADVGGGSTEIICVENNKKKWWKSIELGAVVLKELFNLRYPLNSKLMQSLKDYIRKILSSIPVDNSQELVITGGTASLLGALDLKLKDYVPEKLHGHGVTKDRLEKLIKKLANFDLERLRRVKGMEEGREDIALPGLLIYSEIMEHFKKDSLVINEYGILEGTLLSLIEGYNNLPKL
ncbi:MAG: HU family DNA-binding protein [Thermodesulfobacterium sp.]|nr:HU family DNA-binding protein [Thermodesulfobacterium sp.]